MSTKERHSLALPAREMQCSVNSVLSVFSPHHLRRESAAPARFFRVRNFTNRCRQACLKNQALQQIPAARDAIVELVAKRIGCTARKGTSVRDGSSASSFTLGFSKLPRDANGSCTFPWSRSTPIHACAPAQQSWHPSASFLCRGRIAREYRSTLPLTHERKR